MRRLFVVLFLAGCTQSVTALESIDAAVDAVTVPDGGMLANLCAHPELFDGMEVEMSVTGIQQTDPQCLAGGCDAGNCCNNTCDAYWVLPCAGGGQLTFAQGGGFGCFGNVCDAHCDPWLVPSDVLTFTATVHLGGRSGSCCGPIVIGVDAIATFEISNYMVTSLPDS